MTKSSLNIRSLAIISTKSRSEKLDMMHFQNISKMFTLKHQHRKKYTFTGSPARTMTDARITFVTSGYCISVCGERLPRHMSVSKGRTRTSWTSSRAPPQKSWAHLRTRSAPSDTTGGEECTSWTNTLGPALSKGHSTVQWGKDCTKVTH